jgi:ABC-type multidrug transport system ATPase subunit
MTDAPLLAAENLRIDVGDAIAIERASFASRGNSVALLGDEHGVLSALAGSAKIRAGNLAVLGIDVAGGAHLASNRVAIAALDPPLPPRWTALEYLTWGARLAGADRTTAARDARAVLGEFGLEGSGSQIVESLPLIERRVLVLAQAVIAKPEVLVATAPLSGLGGREAAYVAAAWAQASRGRKWIVSVSNLHLGSAESTLAQSADDLLLFASGSLVRQGKLDRLANGAVGYTVTVRSRATELRAALLSRGVELTGGPSRFFVELPQEMKAQDLLALSADVGAPIVELVPRIPLGEGRP